MLDCLEDLAKHGFCVSYSEVIFQAPFDSDTSQREMPVFGLTHDQVVSGIIVSGSLYLRRLIPDKYRMKFLLNP